MEEMKEGGFLIELQHPFLRASKILYLLAKNTKPKGAGAEGAFLLFISSLVPASSWAPGD